MVTLVLGALLQLAIKKYGSKNFFTEIIQFAETREELDALERKYVGYEEICDPMCYNEKIGGDYIRSKHKLKLSPYLVYSINTSYKKVEQLKEKYLKRHELI